MIQVGKLNSNFEQCSTELARFHVSYSEFRQEIIDKINTSTNSLHSKLNNMKLQQSQFHDNHIQMITLTNSNKELIKHNKG